MGLLLDAAAPLAGNIELEKKAGVLLTEDGWEPSTALELFETRSDSWWRDGWSLDLITTQNRGGFGVAKDIYRWDGGEVDVGAYVTQRYDDLLRGEIRPEVGVGFSVSF
ncbi:hypothetical protein ACFL1X_03370 [Candidatus Hydrogenedentota bacterium]